MTQRDDCLLDLVYRNEEPQSFVLQLYERIAEECVIDLHNPDEDAQTMDNNQRTWAYMLHIVKTVVEQTPALSTVVALQYALNREESLQETVEHQLNERAPFFRQDWLPFLAHNTIEFTNRFRGDNATEVMQDYVNIMLDAWANQRIRLRPTTPPPEEPVNDAMEIDD